MIPRWKRFDGTEAGTVTKGRIKCLNAGLVQGTRIGSPPSPSAPPWRGGPAAAAARPESARMLRSIWAATAAVSGACSAHGVAAALPLPKAWRSTGRPARGCCGLRRCSAVWSGGWAGGSPIAYCVRPDPVMCGTTYDRRGVGTLPACRSAREMPASAHWRPFRICLARPAPLTH